jgi:hypothetical protein
VLRPVRRSADAAPTFSPDGRRVVLVDGDALLEMPDPRRRYARRLLRRSRLPRELGLINLEWPTFSFDGGTIAFGIRSSERTGLESNIWTIGGYGGEPRKLTRDDRSTGPTSLGVSNDVAFSRHSADLQAVEFCTVPSDGSGIVKLVAEVNQGVYGPQMSGCGDGTVVAPEECEAGVDFCQTGVCDEVECRCIPEPPPVPPGSDSDDPPPPGGGGPGGGPPGTSYHSCTVHCSTESISYHYPSGIYGRDLGACIQWATASCRVHPWQDAWRVFLDAEHIYSGTRVCCAKCRNRSDAYNIGVSSNCAGAASAWCNQSGRGGLDPNTPWYNPGAFWGACRSP